ncbi:MAG: type II/IV secretion system ATPase subunit [Candidatus Woesearchaeota archaeon]
MVEEKKDDGPYKTTDLSEAKKKFAHVREYMKELSKQNILEPAMVKKPSKNDLVDNKVNVIYPVGDPIFIHILKQQSGVIKYNILQPVLNKEDEKLYEKISEKILDTAYREPVPDNVMDITEVLFRLLDKVTLIKGKEGAGGLMEKFFGEGRIPVTKDQYEKVKYFLIRNRVGFGKLQPLFYDEFLEDIHCTGVGFITTVHKVYGMVYTNLEFKNDDELNKFIVETSERVERLVSDRNSVVDAIMPDGSRTNFVYGRDISLEGSSFTIRKFSKVPISITQLINWGTISAELAAYLWLALENGMNVFVCGETASGKTTTLNAISAFIKPLAKVYTVENTPEVTMPHDIWQHLITREAGTESDIGYLDLLKTALRSRPDYIIVGEIRGEEGNVAFQAMQTGHPVLSTFHAGNVQTMIQRLNGDPINIPMAFMDNLNISLIQQAVDQKGKRLRRVLSVSELERYYAPANKVVTREVFTWNPSNDKHIFRGLFNSYILEQKIARLKGMTDPREIYNELAHRKKILLKMVEEGIFYYFDVWEIFKEYNNGGDAALPFEV